MVLDSDLMLAKHAQRSCWPCLRHCAVIQSFLAAPVRMKPNNDAYTRKRRLRTEADPWGMLEERLP